MLSRSIETHEYKTEGNTLVGYGSVFGAEYPVTEPVDGRVRSFTEVVKKGAFARSLQTPGDVLCCFNHSPFHLLGRTSSGTLKVSEDDHGLRFSVELPDTQTGHEVKTLASRGDLAGASFYFGLPADGFTWSGNTRSLHDLRLYEVGPVVVPASRATQVQMRSNHLLFKRLHLEIMNMKHR
jgi:HK97 family phage prohead protease